MWAIPDGLVMARLRRRIGNVALALLWSVPALAADPTDAVTRGRYLATAADCASCHSAASKSDYAGGEPLKSPVGLLYPPNITSDPKNGIGAWTREDFVKAIRLGIGKNGQSLYPAMPYTSYSGLTDADVDALWAYVHQIPAVATPSHPNELKFPFNVRSGLVVWKSAYFTPRAFNPTAGRSETYNRGAYLVTTLGHCGECHTPRGVAQNMEQGTPLDGAQIEGWFAPNISGNAGSVLAKWTVPQLETYLATGKAGDNAQAIGPMREVIDDSLSHLTKADIHAIATYLKQQPATPDHRGNGPKGRDDLQAGARIYADQCASCHQANGKGISGEVPSLVGNDAVIAQEPFNVYMAILQGFPQGDGHGAMGSFAQGLTDDQIAAVSDYIRQAWGNKAPQNATAERVGDWRGYATERMTNEQALLCPNLPADVLQPAVALGAAKFTQAASSAEGMRTMVRAYRDKRPHASEAETVEALSAVYCRQLADAQVSQAQIGYRVATFGQAAARAYPATRSAR